MTTEEASLAIAQIDRSVAVIEKLRTILRVFMDSKQGQNSSNREGYVAFSIIERIYYNLITAIPLIKDLVFNQNIAVPTSHILRGVAYEIVVSYWLLDKDFVIRMAMLNQDFIKKNYRRLEKDPNGDEEVRQRILAGWHSFAPENIDKSADGIYSIKEGIKRFVFSEICDEVLAQGYKVKNLELAYNALSQQAHFSDFSRIAVYEKHNHHIGIFDAIVKHAIQSCSHLVKATGEHLDTIISLDTLLKTQYIDE